MPLSQDTRTGLWPRGICRRGVCPFVWVPLLLLAVGQTRATAQPAARAGFPPPSVTIGEFRAELLIRLHVDARDFDPELGENENELVFRRARVGLQGRLYDDVDYELDAELRDREHPWRDVLINYRRYRAAEVQVGRFKIPFGLDQNTGIFSQNFVERSLIGSELAPGRDRGVMVHGRLARNTMAYQAGVFRRDGDNTRFASPSVDTTWAGRIELRPWENNRGALRSAQIGANLTTGSLFEGLYGIPGRTLSGTVFADPYYVKGRRVRFGADWRWTPGPVSVQAEYIRVRDQRHGQGLSGVDLPDAIAQGWYVSGSWAITGDDKESGGISLSKPFPTTGMGAVELAARLEELRFGSVRTGGEPPSSSPRATNILANRDRILTLGVNWYLNRFGRVTVNGTREDLQDPRRTPILGRTRFWGAVLRLQFVLL
jgi:phosphate-selective porin OprO/OprP